MRYHEKAHNQEKVDIMFLRPYGQWVAPLDAKKYAAHYSSITDR